MRDIKINGRKLAIEFEWASQGHRLTVMEWDGTDWQTLPNYNRVLCILSTQFESLCDVASELFDEAVWAEDMAHKLDIPVRFSDDADCVECGSWYHYADMSELPNGDYVCTDCEAVSMIVKECPNHGGAFDCTPFCTLCNGNQEIKESDEN